MIIIIILLQYIGRSLTRTVKQYNTCLHNIIIIIIIVGIIPVCGEHGGGPSAENDTSCRKKIDKLPLKVPPLIIIPRFNDNNNNNDNDMYGKRKHRFSIAVYQ